MSFEYFEVDSHVSTYNKFRPKPPMSLIKKIVEYTAEKVFKKNCDLPEAEEPLKLAVDVGCGSGQSTEVFSPYFERVLGLDSSPEIIEEAVKKCQHPNVFYSTSLGERMDVEDGSANLISTCQALHWFDIPKFYLEAERVLLPNGVLAVYGYNLPVIVYKDNKEIESLIEKFYKGVLGPYTLPQSRKVYLESYTSEEFNQVPFVQGGKMKREGNFMLETEGGLNDVIGYVTSWSAFQNYTKKEGEKSGEELLNNFEKEFKNILKHHGDSDGKLTIRFNYFLLLGRKK